MMPSNNTRNKRLVLAAVLAPLFLILIAFGIYNLSERSNKVGVSITLYPSDIDATLNDKKIHNGTMYFEPGIYTLKAGKTGFENITKTVTINETQKTLVVSPTATSPEAKKWALENYSKIQRQQEVDAYEIGRDFNARNPIAKELPYKNFFYSVGYRMDQSDPTGNSIIIEIDAKEGYRQAAIYRIRQLGYDPTDFTINFRDYENPFPL